MQHYFQVLSLIKGVGCKPGDIAHVMCSAIGDFLQDNPTHVQEIQLVIFQQDMVFDFIKGMKESVVGTGIHRPIRWVMSFHTFIILLVPTVYF